jgi:hypothetical protein
VWTWSADCALTLEGTDGLRFAWADKPANKVAN